MRRLLTSLKRDAVTPNGCSIHKSSVATCLMSVYLRDAAVRYTKLSQWSEIELLDDSSA